MVGTGFHSPLNADSGWRSASGIGSFDSAQGLLLRFIMNQFFFWRDGEVSIWKLNEFFQL